MKNTCCPLLPIRTPRRIQIHPRMVPRGYLERDGYTCVSHVENVHVRHGGRGSLFKCTCIFPAAECQCGNKRHVSFSHSQSLSLSLSLFLFHSECPEAEVCKQTRKIAQCQAPERAAVFRFMWHRTRDKLCGFSVTCRQQSWIMLRIRRSKRKLRAEPIYLGSSFSFGTTNRWRILANASRTHFCARLVGYRDCARLWDYRRKFEWN
jgi:hypothetical protein